ncbi:hypothetical protein ANCCAN_00830 [Ancylostoma caninum]|uniref:Uncharacterized protein n=1 Tax=Ancylostoma caninum TaxID=29170 RepID=A0A368HC66_ANCCA|nr:hypothetical protein ANCCAN_00830 [Ancylostoma caninum]
MISSLLLTLQVFSAFSIQGLASQSLQVPKCSCWAYYYCISENSRIYLAHKIVETMNRTDWKPKYLCHFESFCQSMMTGLDEYEKYKEDYDKLEHEMVKTNEPKRLGEKELETFINKAVESWKNNITKLINKTRFGCELADTVSNTKLLCLFSW